MQVSIASTFNSNKDSVLAAGALLVDALLDWDTSSSRKDPYTVWFASVTMSCLLHENEKAKKMAMEIVFGEDEDDNVNLLHRIMYQLSVSTRDAAGGGPDVRVLIGLLCFICNWLYDYSHGINEFFVEAANLQFVRHFHTHALTLSSRLFSYI